MKLSTKGYFKTADFKFNNSVATIPSLGKFGLKTLKFFV